MVRTESIPASALALVLLLALLGCEEKKPAKGRDAAAKTVFDVAVKRRIPDGAPKSSDVVMRSMIVRPRNKKDPHDTMKALRDFHVTRMEWSYIHNPDFIKKVKASGRLFGGAMSSALGHVCKRQKDESIYRTLACLNLNGEPVVPTWKRAWRPPGNLWICVNNPEVERRYMDSLKKCLDVGAEVMQRDEPGGNLNAVGWGACFCDHCMKAFRDYLAKNTSQEQRGKLGVKDIAAFSYRDHLKAQGAPVGDDFRRWDGGELKQLFIDFQTEATVAFHKRTRKEFNAYAKRRVPFSCNNGVRLWSPVQLCYDWCFGELSYRHATPDYLYDAMREATVQNSIQVVTMPKKGDYDNLDEWTLLTRQTIAMTYACGGICMAPWDVYMPADAPRYFGTPEQYGDLFGFIRANARYLDGFEEAAVDGNGLEETRYGDTLPVAVADSDDISAIVRVLPGKTDSPVVVHLVDWSDSPKPFRLILNPRRLYGDRPGRIKLLVPAPYAKAAHETADKSRSYAALSKTLALKGGYVGAVDVPAVRPWGLLILEPDTPQADGVWAPSIWADRAGRYRKALVVAIASASQWSVIRYTTDGSEPTAASRQYHEPLQITNTTTIKARAFLEDGRASDVAGATFTKRTEGAAAPLLPNCATLKPALKLWLRADALSEKRKDGDPVKCWRAEAGPDAVVQDIKLHTGNPAGPPSFSTSAMNGMPALRFDGVDDSLAIKDFSNQHLAGKPFTILMVTRSDDNIFGICGNSLNGCGGKPRLYLTRGSFRYNVLDRCAGAPAAKGAVVISTFLHDGKGGIAMCANGKAGTPTSGIPVAKTFGGGNLAIPFWSGNKNHAGDIAEIIVHDRRLTDAEREGVESYLADRYGILYRKRWH